MVLNTSVASTSRSWADNCASTFNVVVVVFVARDVALPRVVLVVDPFVLRPPRLDITFPSVSVAFDPPRNRPCRESSVAFEQVAVDRTASFTDSTEESEGNVVTAIGLVSICG